MTTTWVLVADEAIARILQWRPAERALDPVEELTDPIAHARDRDLRRDAYGRRNSTVTSSAGEDETRLAAERFAREVCDHLAHARQQGRFDVLRVVAAPRFLGLLRRAMDTHVDDAISDELNKQLVYLPPHELADRLFPQPAGSA